jgi:hypothetical protein
VPRQPERDICGSVNYPGTRWYLALAVEASLRALLILCYTTQYLDMGSGIVLLCLLLTGLVGIITFTAYTNKLARRSAQARYAIIKNLGIPTTSNPQFIGFFHPYWYVFLTKDWDA